MACASSTLGVTRVGQRHQVAYERFARLGCKQGGARAGNHHGIDHEIPNRVIPQRAGHGADDLRVHEHASLHGVSADIAQHGLDLLADK